MMYAQLVRHYSVAGYLARNALHALRGLPQGCLFAVWITNAIVSSWPPRMKAQGGEVFAFLDDRTVITDDAPTMQRCFDEQVSWDAEHGWAQNVDKTHLLVVPPGSEHPTLEHAGKSVSVVPATKSLG
eukprot:654198-Amphidinium_carterae.1